MTFVNTPVGSSPANPQTVFTDGDIQNLLSDLIFRGLIPSPSSPQILYCVVLPQGVSFHDPNAVGEHNRYTYYAFPFYWANVRFCWTTNDGTLDRMTTILSHEIAEACTDPDVGSGFIVTAGCPGGGSCEIGDVEPCHSTTQRIDGVLVQTYFSAQSDGCIGDKADKDSKDGKDQKDGKQESKETKDSKDSKDHKDKEKDPKDAKEKDAKEKDRDGLDARGMPATWTTQDMISVNQRLAAIEQEISRGRTFIQRSERPQVGQGALADKVT